MYVNRFPICWTITFLRTFAFLHNAFVTRVPRKMFGTIEMIIEYWFSFLLSAFNIFLTQFFCRWYGYAYCAGKNKNSSANLGNGLTTVWRPRVEIRGGQRCRPLAWCRTRGRNSKGRTAQWRRRTCRYCSGPTAFSGVNTPNRSRPAGKTRNTECLTTITARYVIVVIIVC